MPSHLLLVAAPVDEQLVGELSRLLSEAKAGRLNGIAYAATRPGGAYIGDIVGRTRSFPLHTLGLIHMLQDIASKLAQ